MHVFSEICIANEKHLNFILNIEKQIKYFLKHVNDSQVISATESKRVKPRGSRFGRLYRLSKVHKSLVKNCRSFWCIFSVIKTPSYNITKNLFPISELIITNKFSIKKILILLEKLLNKIWDFSWTV